jgi:DNA/RNA-binding domain of Phe-tRNA-synthetase-like protein
MEVQIDESIRNSIPNCRLAYITVTDVAVRGTPPALTQEFLQLQAAVAKAYHLDILPTMPRIAAVRNMYKKLNFDPSRYRPASEALVRRVLQNKGLYYVNSAVDVNNYCSIKFLLPFGIYDLSPIQGDVNYRLATEGTYVNIAGNEVSTNHKPFLTDDAGPFGNPTSDARRTAVTLGTRNLLSVIYADEEVTDAELADIADFTADMLVRYNGGIIADKKIVHSN